MAKSYRHLFASRYEFPMKLQFRMECIRKMNEQSHQKRSHALWEYCYINLRDVYLSTNKRTIMFQIELSNFELMKHWYTDDTYVVKGFYISDAVKEKFKKVLMYMNYPHVRVDIMNDHPLSEMVY